jgi:hypothetical protein
LSGLFLYFKNKKMKMRLFFLALTLGLTWMSCKNDSPSTTPAETTEQQAAPAADPAGLQATPATDPAAAGNLNPPHGQPGHRCDIAVGAPLDSPPGTQNPASGASATTTTPIDILQKPAENPTNTNTSTTTVAEGMNPPHGQPGHRCDIAVGAPLDSKPKQ